MKEFIKTLSAKSLSVAKKIWSSQSLRTFALLAIIILLIITNWNSCQKNNALKQASQQNEQALKNDITVQKNKNNELQYSVVLWQGKAGDLDKYNKDLANELKTVKNSKIKTIIKTEIRYLAGDTIIMDNTVENFGNGEYKLGWGYVSIDSSRILNGESHFNAKLNKDDYTLNLTPGKTFITKDEVNISLITGVKHNKKTGLDEIFVTPKTPGVSVIGLEGAIIDPSKNKKFTVTAGVGYGVGINKDNALILTPTISVVLGKSIFSF